MKRVEGHNNLYRNDSGAIVNTDSAGYEAYKAKRNRQRRKDEEIHLLSTELNQAKSEIEELKKLIMLALEDKTA